MLEQWEARDITSSGFSIDLDIRITSQKTIPCMVGLIRGSQCRWYALLLGFWLFFCLIGILFVLASRIVSHSSCSCFQSRKRFAYLNSILILTECVSLAGSLETPFNSLTAFILISSSIARPKIRHPPSSVDPNSCPSYIISGCQCTIRHYSRALNPKVTPARGYQVVGSYVYHSMVALVASYRVVTHIR